jgi:hypothetical protein
LASYEAGGLKAKKSGISTVVVCLFITESRKISPDIRQYLGDLGLLSFLNISLAKNDVCKLHLIKGTITDTTQQRYRG